MFKSNLLDGYGIEENPINTNNQINSSQISILDGPNIGNSITNKIIDQRASVL